MKEISYLLFLLCLGSFCQVEAQSDTFLKLHENLENGFRGFVLPTSWESDDSFYTTSNQDTLLLTARYFVFKRRFADFNQLVQKADSLIEDDVLRRIVSIEHVNAENEQYQHEVADSLIFELKKSTVVADEYYEIWLDILFTAVLNRTKMYDEAVKRYRKTETAIDSLHLNSTFTYTHINIANSYYRLGEVEFAHKLYEMSLASSAAQGNKRMLGIAHNNIAINLLNGHKGFKSSSDSALFHIQKAKDCFTTIGDSAKLAGVLMTEALNLMNTRPWSPKYDIEAEVLLKKADSLFDLFPNYKKKATTSYSLGSINWYAGKQQLGLEYLSKALTLTKRENFYSIDGSFSSVKSNFFKELNMLDSAIFYSDRAAKSTNRKKKLDQTKNLMAFYALYETETYKNESLAKSLEIAQNELKIQSQQTKQNYLLGSGLFALLIGGYALRSQRKKRKASELALIEREAAAEREVEELMQQHRYANLAASIDAEEKERDRLSKELHDGVGSTISGIAMQLEAIRNDEQVESLSPLLVRLRSSYDELRTLSRNIGMPAVKENTLVELTGTLLGNVQADSSLQINYVVFPKEKAFNIDQRIEISVYRIIQEAMNNIMKHAQASMVEVQLTRSEAELDVMIEDDGKGFDANVLAKGIGLKNMKDRIQSLGGALHIDSRKGKGTILSFTIPLKD